MSERAGERVTIRKYKYQNGDLWMQLYWEDTVWHFDDGCLLALEAPDMPFVREDKVLLGTNYAILYFYTDQPFYFYELYAPAPPHAFEGWYCNINAVPERTPDGYSYIDLDLDIRLHPDLSFDVLDEDEFLEHRTRYAYPPDYVAKAEQTLEQLRERIAHQVFPFRTHIGTFGETLEFLAARYGKPAMLPAALDSLH